MSYDGALAGRVRQGPTGRAGVIESRCSAVWHSWVAGNMCCGVRLADLILQLDAHTGAKDLGSSHARDWDFMKRPMPRTIAVGVPACNSQRSVNGRAGFEACALVAAEA